MSQQKSWQTQSLNNFNSVQVQSNQTQDLEKNFQVMGKHFQDLLEKNEAYFRTIEKQVGQSRPKIHLSVDFKKGSETLYQKDFGHKTTKSIPILNFNNHQQYKSTIPMKVETINRTELRPHSSKKLFIAHKNEQPRCFEPFNAASTYNSKFSDWKIPGSLIVKNPHQKTVLSDINFNYKSQYQENFIPLTKSQDNYLITSKRSQYANPLSPGLPFITESWNQKVYKAFKTNQQPKKEKQHDIQQLPSYYGQFKTTHQQEFVRFNQEPINIQK